MFDFCNECSGRLWSNYSKQVGVCPECKPGGEDLKDLEEILDELLSGADER